MRNLITNRLCRGPVEDVGWCDGVANSVAQVNCPGDGFIDLLFLVSGCSIRAFAVDGGFNWERMPGVLNQW